MCVERDVCGAKVLNTWAKPLDFLVGPVFGQKRLAMYLS
jgi:hypothetical protein